MPKAATKEDLFENGSNPLGNKETGALRSFIERIEYVQNGIDALKDDQGEIFDEAKIAKFDVKAMRRTLAARKKMRKDREKWQAEEDAVDRYLTALGLA